MRCTNSDGYWGSPSGELELVAEVVFFLEDCLGGKGVNCHGQQRNLRQLMSGPQGAKPPEGGGGMPRQKGALLR